jgi:exodeoxyribonuclease VII large subunit
MGDEVYSVAELTASIRERLEGTFGDLWVEGEISNHRLPGSGHHYFTLKDAFAQLSCVFFKGAASRQNVRLADGMQVQVFGSLSVYEARGQYQLVAQVVQAKGHGDLQAKFEALKQKLLAEGLFDRERKRPLPSFPRCLAVVTSSTGAAIRDILNVLGRRAPWLRIVIVPVRVQGDGSAEEIAAGIRLAQEDPAIGPDLILVTRGGGSIEDLWAFNEEVVARAIYESTIPVLTGIGHEIDFTIADFVADRREPTPSAAAETLAPDVTTMRRELEGLLAALENSASQILGYSQQQIAALGRELQARNPRRQLESLMQSLDYLGERFDGLAQDQLAEHSSELAELKWRLDAIRPEALLTLEQERIQRLGRSLDQATERCLQEIRQQLARHHDLLRSLNPTEVLRRGYTLTYDAAGQLVASAQSLQAGDQITTRFANGNIISRVELTDTDKDT